MKDSKKPAWQKALEDQAKSKAGFSNPPPGSPVHDLATCPLCSPVSPPQTVTHFGIGVPFSHAKGEKCGICDDHPAVVNAAESVQQLVISVQASVELFAAQQEALAAIKNQTLWITSPGVYAEGGMIQSVEEGPDGLVVKGNGPVPGTDYADSMRLLRAAIPALAEYTLREIGGDEYDYGVEMFKHFTHRADCPMPLCPVADKPLAQVIMHLNDEHGWPRVAGEESWKVRQEGAKLAKHEDYVAKGKFMGRPVRPEEESYMLQQLSRERQEFEQLSARLAGHNIADWLDEYSARTGTDLSFRIPDEETEEKDNAD